MTVIDNRTGVPHFWFEQTGPEGERLDVMVVRATFCFGKNGNPMELAAYQSPVAYGDVFSGPVESQPYQAVIKEDGDLVPYKPGTDIIFTGCAQSPSGAPCTDWIGGIRVGQIEKRLRFFGQREFRRTLLGWDVSKAQRTNRVHLDYRLAYGGCIDIPGAITPDGEPDTVRYRPNPAGCGWLPPPSTYAQLIKPVREHVNAWVKQQKILRAPQIESADRSIRNPFDDLGTHGLGPIPRWCEPRLSRQGTYDTDWQKERYPLLPWDFDSRYFQSAHPDLIATPHLVGDEVIELKGILDADADMRLPAWKIIAVVRRESGEHSISLPLLDTVRFDLDTQRASLVWRMHFAYEDPVVELTLGATTARIEGSKNEELLDGALS